ncbi:DUF3027 domain-containing protein [Gryllotalpicola protaetiae]|uniref:DUF3027 domain-containing protein n=1 Tax=Gryllotalpicola protaetiae TaxID=2419771 RepID=A0A387BN60_9MICO|nr:DUF3027 domain-containing protein [Gryllotalpicola protaetiae]
MDADASAEASLAPEPIADEVLLGAVDAARAALIEITPAATVGAPVGHLVEGERVLSLLFENTMTGYPGWFWTVSLSREPDSSEVNVLEAELMPGDDALLAPDWVPWADRLAEYQAQKKAEREAAAVAGEPEPDDDFLSDSDSDDESDEELDDDESDELGDDDDDVDVDDLDVSDLNDFDDEVDDFDESSDLQGAEEAALASDEEE